MWGRKPKIGSGMASCSECPQRESDSWPSAPEADALSTELQGRGTFRSLNDVRLCRAVFGMVLIDVAPETIAAKRASSPSVPNDRWRESGDWIGFYQQRRGQTRSCQIPSGRAAGSVANHPAGPGSSYRLVSDAIVRSLPESSPLIGWIASCLRLESNQHPRCFRPLLYHLSHRGSVRRTVMGSGS